MEERAARSIAEHWSGGGGLVPRGPRTLLACVPATRADVERHTGRHPARGTGLWRLEVGGRFLSSGGLVYPGGVPYPEELQHESPVVAGEVWLYVDQESQHVLGTYWWPDAVRRPVAAVPVGEYPEDAVMHPSDARERLGFELRVPQAAPWDAALAVCLSRSEAIVFCLCGVTPDPLHEMLVFEQGGLSMRALACERAPDLAGFLRSHQPPYRRLAVGGAFAVGRDPGRALGPQTWPWPGELRWWSDGVAYELKGFVPLAKLQQVAGTVTSP